MGTRTRVFEDVSAGLWRPEFEGSESDDTLAELIAANRQTAREHAIFRDDREKFHAASFQHPVPNEKAFALLGLLLGALPPASIFVRVLANASELRPEQIWVVALLLLVNTGAAVTGFFTGKVVGRSMAAINRVHPVNRVFALIGIGLLWGMVAGAAGGVFFFVMGAFFGSILGGMVGAVALPVFAVLHNFLRAGDAIDRRHLLPLAFGVTLTICAFIFGLS